MTTKNRATLLADLLVVFPDNASELITPAVLRGQQTDIIESYLNFLTDASEVRRISSEQDWIDNTADLGGGVRQMQNNFTYLVSGSVDHSFTIRAQGINRVTSDNVISASNNYTGTGFAYSCTSASDGISFDNITITASSGVWMGATAALFIATDRCTIISDQLGTIDADVVFLAFTRFGNVGVEFDTVALLFTTVGGTSVDVINCAFFPNQATASLPCLNFQTSTYGDIRVESTKFNLGGSNRSLVGLPSGGNLANAGFVNHCDMTGSADPLLGISPSDDPWVFTGNLGVGDSVANLGCFVTGNVAATVITTGSGDDGNPIKVNVSTLASSYADSRYSVAASGTITHTGTTDTQRSILITGIADAASGTNKNYTFYVAINGTVIVGSASPISLDSADPGRFATQALINTSLNNTIDLFVENNTDETDITITSDTCVIS